MSRTLHWAASLMLVACSGAPAAAPTTAADPSLEEPAGEAGGQLEQGVAAIQQGDFARAKRLLGELCEQRPEHARAQFYYGVALHNLSEMDPAIAAYQRAVALDPKLTEAWVNLSAALLDVERADEALSVAERGLEAHPDAPELLYNRALALRAQNRTDDALSAYARALEAGPDNPEVKYGYAEALIEAGDRDRARPLLESLTDVERVDILASSARLLGGLGAFDACVRALDKALGMEPLAELHVQRGLCRHGRKDEPGALADFQAAVAADPSFAPAHYYLGMHHKTHGDRAKARAALGRASELGADSGVGRAAKKALNEL